jgi:acetyl esterase
MPPLAPGARFLGALLRMMPGGSVANMSSEDVLKSQRRAISHNLVTDLLFGTPRKQCSTDDRVVPGPAGPIPVRVYTPVAGSPTPRPLIVYFHGGGWVFGDLTLGDWVCSTVACDLPATVVSVDYRLAPTHPFPAGLDDCYHALGWASENAAALGADGTRLGVMGDSAGGNLAAVMCLLARDRGGPEIGHQALMYPAVDGRAASALSEPNVKPVVLSVADMRAFLGLYLGSDGDPADWRVSPLLAPDHRRLPPALVQLAGHDPLHDEGARYAAALRDAGVPVTVAEHPTMPHGFVGFPRLCRDSATAVAQIVLEQRRALGTG